MAEEDVRYDVELEPVNEVVNFDCFASIVKVFEEDLDIFLSDLEVNRPAFGKLPDVNCCSVCLNGSLSLT